MLWHRKKIKTIEETLYTLIFISIQIFFVQIFLAPDIDQTLSLSGLRLLGIGRNQYIDLMNQCRSSKVRKQESLMHLNLSRSFYVCAAMLMKCAQSSLRIFSMKIIRWSLNLAVLEEQHSRSSEIHAL